MKLNRFLSWFSPTARANAAPPRRRPVVRPPRRQPTRLEVEPLETRITPIIAILIGFRPTALVAVNPQPLPPQAVVLVEPQPILAQQQPPVSVGAPANTPVHLQGSFTEAVADPIFLNYIFHLDGQVVAQPPAPTSAPGSFNDTFSLSGTATETLAAVGSTTPLWTINTTMKIEGSLLGVVHPSQATNEVTTVELTFQQITTELQNMHGAFGDNWDAQTTTMTTGSGRSELMSLRGNPGPWNQSVTDSFAVQDHFHQTLTPVVPPGDPPDPIIVDGVFIGFGFADGSVRQLSGGTELRGSVHASGTLTETIVFPPPSPTAPPPTETVAIDILSFGTFDEVLQNPMP